MRLTWKCASLLLLLAAGSMAIPLHGQPAPATPTPAPTPSVPEGLAITLALKEEVSTLVRRAGKSLQEIDGLELQTLSYDAEKLPE